MKQKTNSKAPMTVQTVHLEDEVNASFLVPKYVLDGRPLAIVDESVLERLKKLLKAADIADILGIFKSKMERVYSLEQWVNLLSEELAFHKTVNMLDSYFDASVEKIVERPFNVTRELTITEKIAKRNELAEQVALLDKEIEDYNFKQEPQIVSNKQ